MASSTKIIGHEWNFANIWNEALLCIPDRPLIKRSNIWASEILGSYIDRYLRMNAVPFTNAPNDRSKRKFSAGHLTEWVVGIVLTSIGVLKQRQLRGEVELPNMLKVSGKLDYVAGGRIDWENAAAEIKRIQQVFALSIDEMPPFVYHAINFILKQMRAQFETNPLKETVLEVKSVSSFMSDKIMNTQRPLPHHEIQAFHYLLCNKEVSAAKLVYICKDDCICHEFDVVRTKSLMQQYVNDVEQMTGYFNAGFDERKPLRFAPPKELEVLFDEGMWRFSTNYKIEYSPYLTMVYGFGSPMSYREKWDKTITAWNRVFKRIVREDNITASNKSYIDEMKKVYPDLDKYVERARKAGAFQMEAEVEE